MKSNIAKPVQTTEIHNSFLEKILAFLKEIEIDFYLSDEFFDSFLKGIKIVNGKLKINPKHLLCLGDILHEAGHLACLPSNLRSQANDNIEESLGEAYTFEMGTILWSVAAASHLKIPLSEIFHGEGYLGQGPWLLEQFSNKNYIGLPLLQWMGLTAFDDELIKDKVLPFPAMLRWVRA